ncbi:hypothetical protein Tcan_11014 [Toxocara canis]|uniref:Uncharacterized protein n=1 Tax=Toxocara canis TaxID=6265 RepID=A0A0B2W302_TOXCA|nr:hypothetical protein Tcan_11014 [Toxocara canis]
MVSETLGLVSQFVGSDNVRDQNECDASGWGTISPLISEVKKKLSKSQLKNRARFRYEKQIISGKTRQEMFERCSSQLDASAHSNEALTLCGVDVDAIWTKICLL